MDIDRIFGLHWVLKEIKAGIINILISRDINSGETITVNSSFVCQSEVYNIKVEVTKPEEPEDAYFGSSCRQEDVVDPLLRFFSFK